MFNDFLDNEGIPFLERIIYRKGTDIYIKTSEIIYQIHEQAMRINADIIPLKFRDFRTPLLKANYIKKKGDVIKIDRKM